MAFAMFHEVGDQRAHHAHSMLKWSYGHPSNDLLILFKIIQSGFNSFLNTTFLNVILTS